LKYSSYAFSSRTPVCCFAWLITLIAG
jgi:hypothetical protein